MKELHLIVVLIGEVGESVDLIDDTTNDFAGSKVAPTGDSDDVAFL